MNPPDPVQRFAEENDIELSSMPSEGIEWMLVLDNGPVEAKVVHFNDEDGKETTFEMDNAEDESSVFGYVNPNSYIYQAIQDAPVMTGSGMMLRFEIQSQRTGDVAIGVSDDGDLQVAFFGVHD